MSHPDSLNPATDPDDAHPVLDADPTANGTTRDAPTPEQLAARQQAVVAALTGTDPTPSGFNDTHVDAARRALLRKRAGELHYVWPLLSAALGPQIFPLFAEFAASRPTRGLRTDGFDFACWLDERGRLPLAGALELAEARIHWVFYDDGRPPQPNRSALATASFPGGRLVRVGRRVHTIGRPRL